MKKLLLLAIAAATMSCGSNKPQVETPRYKGSFTAPPTRMPHKKVPGGAITGNGDVGIVYGGTPESQIFYLSKNDMWKAKNGYPDGGVCYIGTLELKAEALKGASYLVEQQIGGALLTSDFKTPDYSFDMKTIVAATDNVQLMEISAGEKAYEIQLLLNAAQGSGSIVNSGTQGDIVWIERKFEEDGLVFPTKVAVAMRIIGSEDGKVATIGAGKKATVLLAYATNHDTENYREAALAKVAKCDIPKLKDAHADWWSNFWSQSHVELGDSLLESYYYGSHYLLACCSRNNNFPPGLWGNSLTMDATAAGWAGDYHMNYNHQAPWWGVYSSNMVSLSDPYDTPILDYLEAAKSHAREFLGKNGAYYPVGIGPKGFCSSMYPITREAMMHHYGTTETGIEGGFMFLGQKSNGLFGASNMLMRFYHTYDTVYAKKVYPYLRAVADFYEDYLVLENGRYMSYDDCFWEVGVWEGKGWREGYGDTNPLQIIGMGKTLFNAMVDISTYLGVDAEKQDKWRDIAANLPAIPTDTIDGMIRIKATEAGTGSGARTAPGLGRVMMHSILFPNGSCGTVTDPAFAKVLCDEIDRWGVVPQGDATWDNLTGGIETYFTSAARAGYDGEKLLAKLKERIAKTALPNLWVPQEGGGTESLSAVPSAINEMLLQGYEGVVRVFPVWNKSRDAKFTTLRTYGAFLVSSELKNSEVQYVEIRSEKGRPCRFENPWGEAEFTVIRVDNSEKEILSGKYVDLSIQEGERIRIVKNS